ncbi:SDR family oxidoreductase, partial [Fibrobacterota bacterium]
DLRQPEQVEKCVKDLRPDAVIHMAAASDPNFCQEHEAVSEKINIQASTLFAELCRTRGIPFLFTSTDLVFDGTSAPYREQDPVSPVSIYGRQKAIAEKKVLEIYPGSLVCRMPLMFGMAGPIASSILQPMLKAMAASTPLHLFEDEFRTPLSAPEACKGLLKVLPQASGMLHLGGPDRISRYELGIAVKRAFNMKSAVLNAVPQNSIPMTAPRPPDVSLNSDKARKFGFNPPGLEVQLKKLALSVSH